MAQDVQRAQQRLRQAEALVSFVENGLASGSTNQNELRIARAKYEAARLDLFDAEKAAAGTPPENAAPASNPTPEPPPINDRVEQSESPAGVSADTSPTANQADAPSRRNRRQRAQAQRSAAQDPEVQQAEEVDASEFGDIQRDLSVEPEVPTEDAPVNAQRNNRARAQAARVAEREPADPTEDSEVNQQQSNRERTQNQRIENATPGEVSATSPAAAQVDSVVSRRAQAQINRFDRTVASDPTSYESLTDEQLRTQTASTQSALNSLLALPTQERLRVQAQIDALENQLDLLDQETARRRVRGSLEDQVASGKRVPEPVDDQEAQDLDLVPEDEEIDFADEFEVPDPVPQVNSAALERLKSQAAIRATREPANKGDWRVRLQLAPNAPYFYNSTDPGILAPLRQTDGIIFPYTPRISIAYQAQYNKYLPTHSNYNNYWYSGSSVGEINIDAEFTAQDTQEANYLLAVIHFLKSASKMFYGQDADRGSPPPVLFLTGFGEYQFNEHPVIISQFNYVTPNDINYIRANATQINGQTNGLQFRKPLSTNGGPSWAGSTVRKLMNGLPDGGEVYTPAAQSLSQNNATYVPTRVEFNMQLLPVNTRRETSQRFSLGEYANGNLLRGGFW